MEISAPQAGAEEARKELTMSAFSYHGSRSNEWFSPRPHRDAHQRYRTYGPIQPMDQPGLLERLFRRS